MSSRDGLSALCVAVVGPPSSGKTSFLQRLNIWLQSQRGVLAYVPPVNPDGVGKYLQYSPELRKLLRERIKGFWEKDTITTFLHWVDSTRSHLDLVVLDCGGMLSRENDELFRRCSHYILLAREDAPSEDVAAWESGCLRCGLQPVASLHSTLVGQPSIEEKEDGSLHCRFPIHDEKSGQAVLQAIGAKLIDLSPRRGTPGYVDLNRREPWQPSDLQQLETLVPGLRKAWDAEAPLFLGGANTPVWAYAAAMHGGLDRDLGRAVRVFEPKLEKGWVEISAPSGAPGPLADYLDVRWEARESQGVTLDVGLKKGDRLLPVGTELLVDGLPVPEEAPPMLGPIVLYGRLPIWAQLAYTRWLRARWGGERALGVWDGRTTKAVLVHGPGSPAAIDWVIPEATRADA